MKTRFAEACERARLQNALRPAFSCFAEAVAHHDQLEAEDREAERLNLRANHARRQIEWQRRRDGLEERYEATLEKWAQRC